MVRASFKRIFLISLLLVVAFGITGCASSTGPSGRTGPKYYQGYESIEMRFLEDSPPTTFYYDGESENVYDNTIPIFVEVYNKGSSDSYGALFIHGLDPNIFAIEGLNEAYPYQSAINGRWNYPIFSGYMNGDSYAFNVAGLLGNVGFNVGSANINGRSVMSFSTLGFANRGLMFEALGFGSSVSSRYGSLGYIGANPGIANYNVGYPLTMMTRGMFSMFQWNEWLKKFDLEGRNPNNPAGDMEVIEFPATMISLPPSLEDYRQTIMVTACFDYATHASEMVCIDPEPYSNVKKACRPQTVSLAGGQGAPVSVTTIEQRPSKGRTTFVINVRHNSKNAYDELYDYFKLYKCDPASGEVVKATDKNVVYVGYVYLSDLDITTSCIPNEVIHLDQSGNGQITCSIEYPPGMATSAYQAPLEVELWYGYSKTIYKNVLVRRQ